MHDFFYEFIPNEKGKEHRGHKRIRKTNTTENITKNLHFSQAIAYRPMLNPIQATYNHREHLELYDETSALYVSLCRKSRIFFNVKPLPNWCDTHGFPIISINIFFLNGQINSIPTDRENECCGYGQIFKTRKKYLDK